MSSIDKMKLLMELQRKHSKVKITSIRDEVYLCKLHSPAEDEDDWAYRERAVKAPCFSYGDETSQIAIAKIKNIFYN